MWQIFRASTALVVLAFAINAIAVVVVLAIAVGLILRPKQTLSLLCLFGALAILAANPAIGLAAFSAAAFIFYIRKRAGAKRDATTRPSSVKFLPPPMWGDIQ